MDILHEVYKSSLLFGAKSAQALIMPPAIDLLSNIAMMANFTMNPNSSHGIQVALLVSMSIHEMIEVCASSGVMIIYGMVWFFNRNDYYMIDTVSNYSMRNAAIMAAVDCGGELLIFAIFNKIVRGVWKVSLVDLGQAFIRGCIGVTETCCVAIGLIIYLFVSMNYHYGCDYFFTFEWLNAGENSTIVETEGGEVVSLNWCQMLQSDGKSCYN